MRKIIQISESSSMSSNPYGHFWGLSALCDDGSIWALDGISKEWTRLPDIPQDEQQTDTEQQPL
ncbi:hypothetical protein AB6W71_10970 [Pasteurella multocida]|uniref:hypothetical protein n=2 Tax=Pasteurella multocida TaxID=747 RepID=UPI0029A6AA85|nr:hypothetical protein [Pasteurella multocida]MDX3898653.1 hypothetical protein [Pasteurella multocida]MDX3956637.1 hypothetical protein [Pasteurella multocida]MDX3981268.1 hypothetical protein [Pasteurella multocida]HDR1413952.1 hypothetical protein [Pasteurella multocida]HDR1420341.1 hypothetical protein [Pasteurella multocida]